MFKMIERRRKRGKGERVGKRERERSEREEKMGGVGWDVGGFFLAAVPRVDIVYRFNCEGIGAVISRRELERRALRNTKLAPGPASASRTHKNSKWEYESIREATVERSEPNPQLARCGPASRTPGAHARASHMRTYYGQPTPEVSNVCRLPLLDMKRPWEAHARSQRLHNGKRFRPQLACRLVKKRRNKSVLDPSSKC